jgi:HEAT repeat protein
VHAAEVTVREVLEALALRCRIEITSQATLDDKVSMDLAGHTLHRLLRRLLPQDSFLFVEASPDGWHRSRLWILARQDRDAPASGWQAGVARPADLDRAVLELADADRGRRVRAITRLALLGGEDARLAVATTLRDTDAAVREEAVHALAEIDGDASVPLIEQALHDPSERVRESAVAALADLANPAALAALERLLQYGDVDLRIAVVEELADMDPAAASALLQRATNDGSPQVARIVAEYVAEPGFAGSEAGGPSRLQH